MKLLKRISSFGKVDEMEGGGGGGSDSHKRKIE